MNVGAITYILHFVHFIIIVLCILFEILFYLKRMPSLPLVDNSALLAPGHRWLGTLLHCATWECPFYILKLLAFSLKVKQNKVECTCYTHAVWLMMCSDRMSTSQTEKQLQPTI